MPVNEVAWSHLIERNETFDRVIAASAGDFGATLEVLLD